MLNIYKLYFTTQQNPTKAGHTRVDDRRSSLVGNVVKLRLWKKKKLSLVVLVCVRDILFYKQLCS